jgi:predicted glycoside hydrolase/deacetylase ChbG (UPF0249 family)
LAVIFNADDFGFSPACNAGIIACHERGPVRSASVMAGGEAFGEAADYARKNPALDLGVHLALCDARPVCKPGEIPSLAGADGKFAPGFGVFVRRYATGGVRLAEVEKEFRAQVEKALQAGIAISHLDSHQHLHALPAIFELVVRLAGEYRIPAVRCPDECGGATVFAALRQGRAVRLAQRLALSAACGAGRRAIARTKGGVAGTDHFSGFMDMGRWNEASLRERIGSLQAGVTEICCHPRSERGLERGCDFQAEMEALTSEGLKRFLEEEKVRVTSFGEYFTNPAPPESPASA